jgi:hypothetical protein
MSLEQVEMTCDRVGSLMESEFEELDISNTVEIEPMKNYAE